MTDKECELLDNAITTLVCALAFDEAFISGAAPDELEELRGHWVPDAERIVMEAESMGLLDDGLDEEEDFDDYDDK